MIPDELEAKCLRGEKESELGSELTIDVTKN